MKPNAIVACTAKKQYETEVQAKDTAEYLLQEKNIDLKVYKCNICEQFHLSSR